MNPAIIILIIAVSAAVLIPLIGLLIIWLRGRKVLQQWRLKAQEIGFDYELHNDAFPDLLDFTMIQAGENRTAAHILHGVRKEIAVSSANIIWESADGGVFSQSIGAALKLDINIPRMIIMPNAPGGGVTAVVARRMEKSDSLFIDVRENEPFNQAFRVLGDNTEAIQKTLNPELCGELLQRQDELRNWVIECGPAGILLMPIDPEMNGAIKLAGAVGIPALATAGCEFGPERIEEIISMTARIAQMISRNIPHE